MEFFELYLNDQQFWDHGKADSLKVHYEKIFSPQYRKSQSTCCFGITDKGFTGGTLKSLFKPKFVQFQGYLCNKDAVFPKERSPLLIKIVLKGKETENQTLIEKIKSEIVFENENILTFIVYELNETVEVLITSVTEEVVLDCLKKFEMLKDVEIKLNVYSSNITTNLQDAINKLEITDKKITETEVGYIIHPEASFSQTYEYVGSFVPKLKKVPTYEQEYYNQIKYWIEQKNFDVDKKDKYNKTMLFYATESNFFTVVKYLLEKNAKIENDDYQPLCEACHNYNIEIIELLLKHGADVNVIDFEKNSPLHWIFRGIQTTKNSRKGG
jgi:hypothetical protein